MRHRKKTKERQQRIAECKRELGRQWKTLQEELAAAGTTVKEILESPICIQTADNDTEARIHGTPKPGSLSFTGDVKVRQQLCPLGDIYCKQMGREACDFYRGYDNHAEGYRWVTVYCALEGEGAGWKVPIEFTVGCVVECPLYSKEPDRLCGAYGAKCHGVESEHCPLNGYSAVMVRRR